ncbi:MAG: flavonol synthase [Cryomorphaceae bacterium BACL29 MAG-121220-bin8]|jgi:isopenicillin N synthase-like dioxygenase|nr:MAG: flavonol synthase [Cryomorphaceae bacterium BACL29 MAG-121220-bin8]|tara:strand:- start:30206 stop:31156 length:951 start_codon:yes stop_codon:yes gene_type:complete
MNNIPSVDLSDFLSNNKELKDEFVKKVGKAFQEIGFLSLKGHFLSKENVDDLYTQIKKFFDLPSEIKNNYEFDGFEGQRGYTSFGKEHAKGKKEGDLKEFWHFGQYIDQSDKEYKYPKNPYVKEVPEFNSVGESTYKALEKTGLYVLRAIALFLELEEDHFDKYVIKGNSILRPIHYPPIKKEPNEAVRAAAHGDINLITLLMGAHGKGLQVKNNNGEWIDAIAEEEEIVVNVGDMLSRYTNNKLKSTIHRVVNPPKEYWSKSRYSIPFFLHPVGTMSLNVLDNCIDNENLKIFKDISAHDFLINRLIDIGVMKKE